MYSIAILALQNCMYSSITGPLDIFAVAALDQQSPPDAAAGPLFQPTIVAPAGRLITAFNGTPIRAGASFLPDRVYDIVFIPAVFGELEQILTDDETIGWLAGQGRRGACLCSVCAGAFLLARTGLLQGKKATTHWNLADRFAGMFPEIELKREKMLVDEGDCITAGGVFAYTDLSLHLVSRFGSPELAARLSRILLLDPARRLQTPYMTHTFTKNHGDADIREIQEWLEENYFRPVSIGELADKAVLGERTFMRKFKRATGETPLEYLQQLRIEAARRLLTTTTENIDEITLRTGYEDAGSFRKLFKRYTGLSPSAYRKKFSSLQ
jgi:transcriptional regulator GlxA family with amidase domain